MEEYYSSKRIQKEDADYNMILGERSNGKSYDLKKEALKLYKKTGKKTVWLRRWDDDIVKHRTSLMFSKHRSNGVFEEIFGDKWQNVYYLNRNFYLTKNDGGKWVHDDDYFMRLMALSNWEHDKDTVIENVGMIVFDEFVTRGLYLNNEFVLFCNVLSTIIRDNGDVKIFMIGNTVSKNCPYFAEMGLTNIYTQKQGTICTYKFDTLKIAVEITKGGNSKRSDKYFAFNNPALKMITNGQWELALYPHLPFEIKKKEICFVFVVLCQNATLQGDCVISENGKYVYIHKKTSEVHDKTLTYGINCAITRYTHRNFLKPITNIQKAILRCYKEERIYFQDNEVGELFNDYIKECIANK